jgi:hypothetical protein
LIIIDVFSNANYNNIKYAIILMRQYLITPSCGKRLIGKGIANRPDILQTIEDNILVIIAGTTNGYVVEEILKKLSFNTNFSRRGFYRGITKPPGKNTVRHDFKGDIIFKKGEVILGKTIFDVIEELDKEDIILKGANSFDINNKAAILIGDSKAGTIGVGIQAVYGRKSRLILPIGLEKRIYGNIDDVARLVNSPVMQGLRLMPVLGEVYTEIEALSTLTGVEAFMFSAGGIYGAEGAIWLGVKGNSNQLRKANFVIRECEKEDLCEV